MRSARRRAAPGRTPGATRAQSVGTGSSCAPTLSDADPRPTRPSASDSCLIPRRSIVRSCGLSSSRKAPLPSIQHRRRASSSQTSSERSTSMSSTVTSRTAPRFESRYRPSGGPDYPSVQARFLAGLLQRGLMEALADIDCPLGKDPAPLPERRDQAERGAIAKVAKRDHTHLRDPRGLKGPAFAHALQTLLSPLP